MRRDRACAWPPPAGRVDPAAPFHLPARHRACPAPTRRCHGPRRPLLHEPALEAWRATQADPFDLVIYHETIEYMDDPLRAFTIACRRGPAPGGCSPWFPRPVVEVARLACSPRDHDRAAVLAFERKPTRPTSTAAPATSTPPGGVARPDWAPLGYTTQGPMRPASLSGTTWNAATSTSLIVFPPWRPWRREPSGKEQAFLHVDRLHPPHRPQG